jgi:hypothetical protein
MKPFLRNNSLSLVLLLLFLLFLVGHAITGFFHYNEEQEEHGKSSISFFEYLTTGAFGESVFENWESEFLQMSLYVVLTAFLFQRGSAESKDPDKKELVDEDPTKKRHDPKAPYPVKKGGVLLLLYKNSLAIVLTFLFLVSFFGHAIFGLGKYNEEAIEHGQAPLASIWQYLGTSQFWFESFQNWQSEFLAIFAIVVLSIWLRQKGSPESKPVSAPHSETGGG